MITALAFSLLLAASPAAPEPVATARVQIGDLNLHSTAGRAELDRRIDRAVRVVCPVPLSTRDLRRIHYANACRAAAFANVTKQRNSALTRAGVPAIQIASNGR